MPLSTLGEDEDDDASTTALGDTKLCRGKKRGASGGDKKSSVHKDPFEEGDDNDSNSNTNDHSASNDAHLIMAVTQAINILISFVKTQKQASVATTNASSSSQDATSNEEYKDASIILTALSHHLTTSLVNDKSMLESITKSSQYSYSTLNSLSSLGGGVNSPPSVFESGLRSMEDVIDIDDPSSTSFSGRGAARGSSTRGGGATSPERGLQQQQAKKLILANAKAVAGRGLASAVMGVLYAMETLGEVCFMDGEDSVTGDAAVGKSDGSEKEEEAKRGDSKNMERTMLRKAVWTSLLTLEASFQLSVRPKLLMVSAVTVPTTGMSSMPASTSSSMMDFDGMLSGVGTAGQDSSSNVPWSHAHTMMGSDTIAMWNGFVQRIMADYKIGFHQMEGLGEGMSELKEENKQLVQLCSKVANSAFSSSEDVEFITLVLGSKGGEAAAASNPEPPAKKAKKGTRKTKQPDKRDEREEELAELSSLLARRPENLILFDCHVSVRRWAVLAFGWLCKGQRRLLETCTTLLARRAEWEKVMELAPLNGKLVAALGATEDPVVSSVASKKKKKKKDQKSKRSFAKGSPSDDLEGLPGSVALVTFVSCMVDVIYDAGATGGLTPPTSGWMDEYVNLIAETPCLPISAASSAASALAAAPASPRKEEAPVRRTTRARATKATSKALGRSSPKGAKKPPTSPSNRVWVRPDVRDETAVLTKYLIECHDRSLQDSFGRYLGRSGLTQAVDLLSLDWKLIINDDDSFHHPLLPKHISGTSGSLSFYPFMHRTLDTLGRTAASSSLFASSDGKSRIMAIGGAIALSRFHQNYQSFTSVVMDAKLISSSVMQISDCLANESRNNDVGASAKESDTEETTTGIPECIVQSYLLNEPLVVARVDKKEEDEEGKGASFSSYGGVFSTSSESGDSDAGSKSSFRVQKGPELSQYAEILSCFIRAHRAYALSASTASYVTGISSLLDSLFSVTLCCYNFQSSTQIFDAVSHSSKKRASVSKKKKRKADGVSTTTASQESIARKTLSRCVLASDALNVIRGCLASSQELVPSSSTKESESRCIRSFFRQVISTDNIIDFVHLGYALEDNLVYPRLVHSIGECAAPGTSLPENLKIYELWERRLWSSHVKLGLTIGRGQAAYLPQKNNSLLGNGGRRLTIFQIIANIEQERQTNIVKGGKKSASRSNERWPLFLPAVQHALVSSTMSCDSNSAQRNTDDQADLFLCNAFLNSVEAFMNDLSCLPPIGSRHALLLDYQSTSPMVVNDNVIMSLQNARLFALAVGRVSQGHQKTIRSRLIDSLQTGFANANAQEPLNVNASRFLSRMLSVASFIVDIVSIPALLPPLSREVGSEHYCLPRVVRKQSADGERSESTQDVCFMGLFGDCHSPSVPASDISVTDYKVLPDGDFNKMLTAIKCGLTLGFTMANKDGGHLLFSSWNAAAKLTSWTSITWEGPETATIVKEKASIDRLIGLRDDLCEVNFLVNGADPSTEQTLLVKLTSNKRGQCRKNEALLSGITSCEKMLGNTTLEITKGAALVPSLPAFAYYEALPVYVSFLISMHTRPGTSNTSSILRFQPSQLQRTHHVSGYTDGDVIDEFPSDDSDMEHEESGGNTVRMNALARLRDACETLGAAPCFPDWLDTSCRMQEGIIPPIAVGESTIVFSSISLSCS